MPQQYKIDKVAEIESRIAENAGLFVVNYNGLTVKQAQELRHQLRECGAEVIPTNGQGHGALAGFLVQHGADVVLCGGIGTGAQVALMQAGIQLFGGLSGAADAAVADYLAGKLVFDPDIHCTHHDHEEGHSCGSHACHADKGGCTGSCH